MDCSPSVEVYRLRQPTKPDTGQLKELRYNP
jgi:hypothetical protein